MTSPTNQMIEELKNKFKLHFDTDRLSGTDVLRLNSTEQINDFVKFISAAKDAEWQAKMDAEIQKAREDERKNVFDNYLDGELCPTCERFTIYPSNPDEWTCSNCGEPVKSEDDELCADCHTLEARGI